MYFASLKCCKMKRVKPYCKAFVEYCKIWNLCKIFVTPVITEMLK